MAGLLKELESYGLSKQNGFVPEKPSQRLSKYYDPWEDILATLHVQLREGTLLKAISQLPILELDYLRRDNDWQRAYVTLAFLVHAVVHGCKETKVPLALSGPFIGVCEHLGIQPVVTYSGLCLYNWHSTSDRQVFSGLQCPASFTGTIDEDSFYLVPVLVERASGKVTAQLLEAHIAAQQRDWNTVASYLDACAIALKSMYDALDELSLCNPEIFYHQIRPHIAGLDVDFERRNDVPLRIKLVGGSAGQSAFFQYLDHMLGVKHDTPLLKEMRAYMPGKHREFLDRVHELPSLAELAGRGNAGNEIELKFDECRALLRKWRDRHIAIVTRYIMLPAQAAARKQNGKIAEVAGTAGSSPVTFLKQVRNDTTIPQENGRI